MVSRRRGNSFGQGFVGGMVGGMNLAKQIKAAFAQDAADKAAKAKQEKYDIDNAPSDPQKRAGAGELPRDTNPMTTPDIVDAEVIKVPDAPKIEEKQLSANDPMPDDQTYATADQFDNAPSSFGDTSAIQVAEAPAIPEIPVTEMPVSMGSFA